MLSRCMRFQPAVRLLLRPAAGAARALRQSRQKSDVAEYFHCTRAVVGTLTNSFVAGALRFAEPDEPINLEKAKQQHATYVAELKKLIPEVVQIPAEERFPDLVYVEDPAVVLDGTALITQMAPPTRAPEILVMQPVLEKMGYRIVTMKEPGAYLDGGDVMFTGREFLVGLSERTNQAGVEALAKAFPDWPVTGITVQKGMLHLKSMSSVAGVDLIAVGNSEAGRIAWREIENNAHFKYKKLIFPDNNGANCLFINGVVLHPPKEEFPESFKVWESLDCPRVAVPNSELAKSDGSLTCNSIRLRY